MDSFNKLADLFRQFPGIGPRQAKRFVFFLLSRDKIFLNELTELISALKEKVTQCESCFRYFQKRNGASTSLVCSICADPNRDTDKLMVVAKDTDLEAMEKSGTYHGKYFVLGGTLTLVERKNADKLRFRELLALIENRLRHESAILKEIILALSANTEGEYTADELRKALTPLLASTNIKITILGRGLSTGSELEYADSTTLKNALKNRSSAS